MRILLVGEYSNVHWTLARGLRSLGHEVTVISDGDHWKGYPRDIDLSRPSPGKWGGLRLALRAWHVAGSLRGYDVVQLINPVFLDLRAERIWPLLLRLMKGNGHLYLLSVGIDKPWVEEGLKAETFRYSDFFLYGQPRHTEEADTMQRDWLLGPKARLFDRTASLAEGIIAGLYENYHCCLPRYASKLTHIPLPLDLDAEADSPAPLPREGEPLRLFIGVQKARSLYKGTDIMLRALASAQAHWGGRMEVVKAESVPYARYRELMAGCHVMLDQLYSYTPAMNALLAMARGLVVIGGGEEEHYSLLGERELRPVVNVEPTEQSVRQAIDSLVADPSRVARLREEGLLYLRRHHSHTLVARHYLRAWGAQT